MEKNELILEKLNLLEKYLIGFKKVMNVEDLSIYSGYKTKYIYKLVNLNQIPFHQKEKGAKLFFEKSVIDEWLLEGEHRVQKQSYQEAFNYVSKNYNRKKG